MKSFFKTLFATTLGCFIALFIGGLVIVGIIGSIAAFAEEEPVTVPSSAVLLIDITKPITEQSSDDPMSALKTFNFNADTKTLGILPAIKAIENAATDPAIKFIYLRNNGMGLTMGLTMAEELRGALKKFRASGKAIIAYGDNYSQADYYLASVADKVYINNEGNGIFTGLNVNMLFFKDLLEKLGIDVQLIRHGKYKAAAEQFVSSNISPDNYKQNKEMLDAIWGTWVSDIADSRDISAEEFNNAVDNLELWNAESLEKRKLIDGALTRSELSEQLTTLFGVEKEKDLKVISLGDYSKATSKTNFKVKEKIAIVYASGEIAMNAQEGLTAKKFYPILNEIKEDSTIKAVVLRVNSPGGDAQAAEIINNELQLIREKKPVVVSMGEYAASGGYWISAHSERIFTDATTLTGSIGVFSLYPSYGDAAKKLLKINNVNIGTNKHSSFMNMVNPLNSTEEAFMQRFVDDFYGKFTELVASGRNLPVSYVDSIAQGRVWAGTDAVRLKLADEIGGIDTALDYAANLAGLTDYRINEYPKVKTSIEVLMEQLGGASSSVKVLSNPYALIESAYKSLKDEREVKSYARLPYVYEFNY